MESKQPPRRVPLRSGTARQQQQSQDACLVSAHTAHCTDSDLLRVPLDTRLTGTQKSNWKMQTCEWAPERLLSASSASTTGFAGNTRSILKKASLAKLRDAVRELRTAQVCHPGCMGALACDAVSSAPLPLHLRHAAVLVLSLRIASDRDNRGVLAHRLPLYQ